MNENRDNSLHDKPILAISIVLILNIFLIFGIGGLLNFLLLDDLTSFFLKFLTRALTWLLLVPLFLGLPNGKVSITENITKIGLIKTTPTRRIVLFSLFSMTGMTLSLWIPSIIFSDWYIDYSLLWPYALTSINPALWEEIVDRGLVLTLLLKRFSEKRAIILGSLIFSLLHLQNLLFGQPPIIMLGQLIFAFVGGLILSTLYTRSGSLIPGIIVHYVIDALYLFLTFSLIQPGPIMDIIIGGVAMLASSSLASITLVVLIMRYFPKQEMNDSDH